MEQASFSPSVPTTMSNDSRERCGRCGDPIPEVSARIVIESGPLRSAHAELNLCSHCSGSLERWFDRRRHGSDRSKGLGSTRARHREGQGVSRRQEGVSRSAPEGTLSPRFVVLAVLFCACLFGVMLLLVNLD